LDWSKTERPVSDALAYRSTGKRGQRRPQMFFCLRRDSDAFADHDSRDPFGCPRAFTGFVDCSERLERDGIKGIF
jgi:hypothetical protein